MQIIAISEMTKQMQGSMILVNKDELKLSARRQSQIIQKELVKWFQGAIFLSTRILWLTIPEQNDE